MFTHIIDVFFALVFIYNYLSEMYKIDKINSFVFLNLIIYFFINSYFLGRNGKKQIHFHLIFRILVLVLFILSDSSN